MTVRRNPNFTKSSSEPTKKLNQDCKIHIRDFADLTGYSLTICEKILKGLTDNGYVDPVEAIRALALYFKNSQVNEELKRKQIELAEEKRKKMELERRLKEGELVEVSKVAQVWGSMLSIIRNRLLQLPQKLAPLVANVDPMEAKIVLEKELTSLLSELKEDLKDELK